MYYVLCHVGGEEEVSTCSGFREVWEVFGAGFGVCSNLSRVWPNPKNVRERPNGIPQTPKVFERGLRFLETGSEFRRITKKGCNSSFGV